MLSTRLMWTSGCKKPRDYTEIIKAVYRDSIGLYWGYIGPLAARATEVILGLYRENGKEHGRC